MLDDRSGGTRSAEVCRCADAAPSTSTQESASAAMDTVSICWDVHEPRTSSQGASSVMWGQMSDVIDVGWIHSG